MPRISRPCAPSGADEMAELRERLSQAKRPLAILGGGGWDAKAVDDIPRLRRDDEPAVGCAFRCQDLFDNTHPNYAGDVGIGINPRLAERVKTRTCCWSSVRAWEK